MLAFVERDADGVTIDEDWNVMGQRATVSGTAVFDDVPVDPALVIPYERAFAVPQQLGARAQLVHAAIQVGIAGGALRDAGEFVRTRARPFFEAARGGWAERASADPHIIRRYGRLATRVRAAEALLAAAAATLDEVTRRPADAAAAARGSVAVAAAKAFGSEVAVEVASDLFSLERRQRRRRALRPQPSLAQRPHPRQPRPGRLEVPPHRQLPAERRPPTQPRAGLAMTAPSMTAAEITAAEFRHAIGHFATGVTVVTSVGPDGEPVGTTANAVSSLSLDPPLVLVCFDRASLTLAGDPRARRVRGQRARRAAAAPVGQLRPARPGRGLGRGAAPPGRTGSPRLHGVLAALECTVEHRLPGGDHEIVVGRVREVETAGDDAAPLLYWRGAYASLGAA